MLAVNLEKTNLIKLKMKYTYVEATVNTKLLGLQFDNHVYHMIPKSGGECYSIRSMFIISNSNTLQ
jgi:hypothetical protein